MRMANEKDPAQEGIAAYQAGEKGRALQLLTQAVKEDQNNEQAWYYLAALQTDLNRRKQCLEMVIKINPNNTKAQELLVKTNERLQEKMPPNDSSQTAPPSSAKAPPAAPANSAQAFKLPVDIPGAPAEVTIPYLIASAIALLRNSIGIFLKRAGAYEDEIKSATWWRFWLTVATGSVVSAIFFAAGSLFLALRYRYSILDPLLTFIFSIPINMAAVYVGCYASHWYATKQAHGLASLVEHSQAMAAAWLPGSIVGAALGAAVALIFGATASFDVLFSLAGLGAFLLGILIALVVAIAVELYTLSIQVKGVQILYKFTGNPLWITTAMMLIATGIVYGLLDRILPG